MLDPLAESIHTLQQKRSIFPNVNIGVGEKCISEKGEEPLVLVVGVSGGADSVCLLHLLHSLAHIRPDTWPLALHVAHFDHGLRAESTVDAAFVQEFADALGVPCRIETAMVDLSAQKGGTENAARHARYNFMARMAAEVTPPTQESLIIVVAHNADDQAETVLMNFVRGSGLDGLGGMDFVAPLPVTSKDLLVGHTVSGRPIQVVRPLLETPRAEIEAYLARHNLRWREDRSNSDTKFLRNRLRHDVMPLLHKINPDLLATLGRNAEIARAEAARINALDAEMLDSVIVNAVAGNAVHLELAQLCKLDSATLRNVVRLALYRICYDDSRKDKRKIGFDAVETIVDAVHALDGRGEISASGPHTLVNEICWTVQAANQFGPAVLSLHREDRVPQAVDQPTIESQTGLVGTDSIESRNGWIMHSETLPLRALPVDWRSHCGPWSVYLDSESVIQPQLTALLVAADSDLKFAPLGMNGRHKSSLGDFFTDRKIAPSLRPTWPLLVDAATDRVLWVCGLQPSHHARITDETKQVLHLWWEKNQSQHDARKR